MTITPFDSSKDLILIPAMIWGPLGRRRCRFALDTGASDTLVTPDVIDLLNPATLLPHNSW